MLLMFTRALLKSGQAVLLLVAGIFIGAALSSFPADFHILATRTKASAREDGTWHQSRYETDLKLIDHGLRIGASWPIGNAYGLELRGLAEYVDLGRFDSDAIATNDDADVWRPVLNCDFRTGTQCLSRYQGTGGAYGAAAGVSALWRSGKLAIGPELGVLFYRSWWDVRVTHFEDCGWNISVCNGIHEYNHATGDHYTPFFGVTLAYKYLYIAARRYHNVYAQGRATNGANKGDVGMFGHGLTEYAAGVRVTF